MGNVEIIIRGKPGTGKSILATFLQKHLKLMGFWVKVIDENPNDQAATDEQLGAYVQTVAKHNTVEIKTWQVANHE